MIVSATTTGRQRPTEPFSKADEDEGVKKVKGVEVKKAG